MFVTIKIRASNGITASRRVSTSKTGKELAEAMYELLTQSDTYFPKENGGSDPEGE